MSSLRFETTIDYLSNLRLHFLLIPSEILTTLNKGEEKGKFNQRVIVRVNDTIEWQGGIVALKDGDGYISFSGARMKKLGLERYDEVNVELKPDNSEFGHEFPEELEELFLQDPTAKERFEMMTKGKQRTIIYYILQAKSSDKRLERSLLYMNNLKLITPGKETMRAIFGK
jgi:hypothetical protein